MLQVVQNYKSGELRLEEVPVPALKKGGIIVRTFYSLVSSGTESTSVKQAAMSLVGKAKARPDDVKKVIQNVKKQGLVATYKAVMNRLDSLTPLGYSMAGIVTEVGEQADGFYCGQRVACGGAGYANHAEYNYIPKNLAVPIPDSVGMAEAACTTVGTVSMQGFRQSGLSLGDTVLVIGLGLVGQIYLQIAQAAGCRTIGVDLNEQRVSQALELGAEAAFGFDVMTAADTIDHLTNGAGVDVVALAVGTDSNEPLELAVQLIRDRGRIVNIGKAKIDVPYLPFFKKDLNLVFSRSYGPGRYDTTYEEKGIDYPVGYVKWTEQRNMMAFLDLLAKKKLNLDSIVKNPIPFDQAEKAYGLLREGKANLGILFKYSDQEGDYTPVQRRITIQSPDKQAAIVLGCIGAGNYAKTKLLGVFKDHKDVRMKAVVTTSGTSSKTAALRFGFEQVSTDSCQILEDKEINAVLIATPHDSHASLICQALEANKAVFSEKPLAIDEEQLQKIKEMIKGTGNDRLQIGFNRRFAPSAVCLKEHFAKTQGPLTIVMRINAGRLEPGRWISDPDQSGGRIVGEGCHFIDLASYFVDQDPVNVQAFRVGKEGDTTSILLRYPNGSVATIVYITSGSWLLPKEYIEIHGGGQTGVIDDFKNAFIYRDKKKKLGLIGRSQNKGQEEEIKSFCKAVRSGAEMPISLSSLFSTTEATLKALKSIRGCCVERIENLF